MIGLPIDNEDEFEETDPDYDTGEYDTGRIEFPDVEDTDAGEYFDDEDDDDDEDEEC